MIPFSPFSAPAASSLPLSGVIRNGIPQYKGKQDGNPYNGPAVKLLTPPTLTLVKMTITGHHMVIQSTTPKIALALMSTLTQGAKVT